MSSPNKKRLYQNLALLLIIAGLALFLWSQQEAKKNDKSHRLDGNATRRVCGR